MLDTILAQWPMLLCFIGGVVMLLIEAFMPGFGVPGISGILLEAVAVWLCWNALGSGAALIMVLIAVVLIVVAVVLSLKSASKGRLSRSSVILNDAETAEAGFSATRDLQAYLGRKGTTVTVLRPTGMAQFGAEKLNVISHGDFIPSGSSVRVV